MEQLHFLISRLTNTAQLLEDNTLTFQVKRSYCRVRIRNQNLYLIQSWEDIREFDQFQIQSSLEEGVSTLIVEPYVDPEQAFEIINSFCR